jgi:methylenetetrahydrofolate dehydrogenase (NADP+)/methenyltetrahydrofolate cyclohydrolase
MSAKIIEGKKIAESIRNEIKTEIEELKRTGIVPGLAVIQVGDNPASTVYVNLKEKTAKELGYHSVTYRLPDTTTQQELLFQVKTLNQDKQIHGILVQLPLPNHINPDAVIYAVAPEKDVDGLHPQNVGAIVLGKPNFLPCTPAGIMELLHHSGISPNGKHVVVLGRSNIVGKPITNMLLQKQEGANATVTLCHTGTRNIVEFTRQADILIAAMGRAGIVTGDMIKPGAVIIDVGTNRVEDSTRKSGYRLVGDVDFASASQVAAYITPVPGGVGPMTITMLMKNTLLAAKRFGR